MKNNADKSRRMFLKNVAVSSGGAVVIAATGQNVMASEEPETVPETKKSKGYQETQHVRDYYSGARK